MKMKRRFSFVFGLLACTARLIGKQRYLRKEDKTANVPKLACGREGAQANANKR